MQKIFYWKYFASPLADPEATALVILPLPHVGLGHVGVQHLVLKIFQYFNENILMKTFPHVVLVQWRVDCEGCLGLNDIQLVETAINTRKL